jgi:pimeloyl-ACP methyl ester carboxylesterase
MANRRHEEPTMTTYVLVPGMWLGGWAWDAVADDLRRRGHGVRAVTLTGVGERRAEAGPDVDLDTHVADVIRAVEEVGSGEVVLVAHSYAGLPVTAAAERLGDRVARVVYVDSGPLPDGSRQADMTDPPAQDDGRDVPAPPWGAAGDPTQAGLDADAVASLNERSTPHPRGSVFQPIKREPDRLTMPLALIACLFTREQMEQMRAQGHPFMSGLGDADLYELPTGHWPMFSEPAKLAALLDRAAR